MARQVVHAGDRVVYDEPKQIEVISAARDPLRGIVGSSGYVGDYLSQFIPVLAQPGPQLYGMVTLKVPAFWAARVRGLRLYAGVGLTLQLQDGGAVTTRPFPRFQQVLTPGWGFTDGYLEFGLRIGRGVRRGNLQPDANRGPGMTPNLWAMETAAIFRRGTNPALAYVPANHGVFPGDPIGALGNMYDITSAPWQSGTAENFDYAVPGPATIKGFFFLNQTNADSTSPGYRGALPTAPTDLFTVPIEERFLYSYPLGRYYRLGCALLVDLMPTKARTSPTNAEPSP